jgi:aspartyl-tRNA synthetase
VWLIYQGIRLLVPAARKWPALGIKYNNEKEAKVVRLAPAPKATTQYDLALNGWEIWGGSIRNHRPEALKKVFEVIGLSEEEIQSRFGHMLEALSFGAPPHGGIAAGLDRIIAILSGEANIREVIAFPKTGDARDLMMQAPSQLPDKALSDVHIKRAE